MKERWYIHVSGYGGFDFEGTAAEAAEMRAHKARWEQGIAHMWLVAEGGRLVKVWGGPDLWPYPPTSDPDRAEELLAIGLERGPKPCGCRCAMCSAAWMASGETWGRTGTDWSAAYNGAAGTNDPEVLGDEGNPDAYAAGAALAMALEDA